MPPPPPLFPLGNGLSDVRDSSDVCVQAAAVHVQHTDHCSDVSKHQWDLCVHGIVAAAQRQTLFPVRWSLALND